MTITLNGTSGIVNDATDLNYTGTLTGGTGVVNLGSGQVYKDASGNVGIGTSSPTTKLNVNGGRSDFFANSNLYAIGVAYNGASGNFYIGATTGATPSLVFSDTTPTERMRIDSSGFLLVNCTTTPSASVGGIRLVNPAVDTCRSSVGGINTSQQHWQFLNGNGVVGSISTSGSGTAYTTSSDYRLKEAVQPMTGALAKVAALKPCTYKWKVDGSDGQGFIAHELAEVVAGCVTGEKDAVDADGNPQYQGIDTSFLVATLAAAIQELKALVDTQAARITALEGTAA